MASSPFSLPFSFCIVFFNLLNMVDARTIKHKPFRLILEPTPLAAFVLCLFFGVAFTLGALSALGKLGNEGKPLPSYRKGAPTPYFTGKLYFFILFFTFLSLIAYYALSAVAIVYTLNQSKVDVKVLSPAFIAARNAMLPLSHWFTVCMLLVLLFQRERLARKEGSSRRYLYKSIFDLVLLATHLSVLISGSSLLTTKRFNTKQVQELNRLGQTLIAFQVILTLDVVVSTVWMWMKLKTKSIPDSIVIGQVVKFIVPFLIVQEIYEIVECALSYALPVQVILRTASSVLFLSRMIVFGLTNLMILWFAS